MENILLRAIMVFLFLFALGCFLLLRRIKLWIRITGIVFLCSLWLILSIYPGGGQYFEPDSERSRNYCRGYLEHMYRAVSKYREQHKKYPNSLTELLPYYTYDGVRNILLLCPDDPRYGQILEDGLEKQNPDNLSYIWLTKRNLVSRAMTAYILAADKKMNHRDGRNALFSTGETKWLSEEEFQKILIKEERNGVRTR